MRLFQHGRVCGKCLREMFAGIAQLVERNLAKVVGGRLVSREIATAAV
jgi:hypothetical protein